MSERQRRATCPNCGRSFEYRQFHAGFGDQGYLYCDSDETVVTWNAYDQNYVNVIPNTNPWSLLEEDKSKVESALKPCPNGGHFAFRNPPRCPVCRGDISSVVPGGIYFVVTGRWVDAEKSESIWLTQTA
jgi:rRNA maturation protein Nop10